MTDDKRKGKLSNLFDEAISLGDLKNDLLSELKGCTERYTEQKFYKSGSSKLIYQAHDEMTDRSVAFARLKEGSSTSQVNSFLREARINALLQHPNIVPVYDIGLLHNEPYFCMKFIAGNSFAEIIAQLRNPKSSYHKRFPRTALLDLFLKICDAMAYAHAHGILHLDLKPDNVRIDRFGDVLICDWGLAQVIDERDEICDEFGSLEEYSLNQTDTENMTIDGFVKGTPGYMAPEQTGMTKFSKGIATDTYALGAMLYSLLCFEVPIEGELKQILSRTANGDFAPPSSHRPDIPSPLEAICLKAMETDPKNRYQSVEDLQKDLLAWRDGYATSAENITLFKLSSLFIKRNKTLCLVVSTALLLLVTLTTTFIHRLKQSKDQALDLAEKYRYEKEESHKRGKVLAPQFVLKYKEAYKEYEFDDALAYIKSAVRLDPENKEAWFYLAQLYCINYRFEESLVAYKKTDKNDSLQEVALKFRNQSGAIDAQFKLKVIDVLMKSHGIDRPASDFVHLQAYSDLKISERIIFVKGILKRFNKLTKLNFHFNTSRSHLDVSNNPGLRWAFVLQNFPAKSINISDSGINNFKNIRAVAVQELDASHTPISDFSYLNIDSLRTLNIAHTRISDLAPLTGSPLQILDIRHCSIQSLESVRQMKFLRNLIVSPGQFSPQQLAKIPIRIEVKIKN